MITCCHPENLAGFKPCWTGLMTHDQVAIMHVWCTDYFEGHKLLLNVQGTWQFFTRKKVIFCHNVTVYNCSWCLCHQMHSFCFLFLSPFYCFSQATLTWSLCVSSSTNVAMAGWGSSVLPSQTMTWWRRLSVQILFVCTQHQHAGWCKDCCSGSFSCGWWCKLFSPSYRQWWKNPEN